MTKPKTKQEAQRLIKELQEVIDDLPDEGRAVGAGFKLANAGPSITLWRDNAPELAHSPGGAPIVLVNRDGLKIVEGATHALDGIAHDEKGRIKVVGYVNAEDLKIEINKEPNMPFVSPSARRIGQIIDKLKG